MGTFFFQGMYLLKGLTDQWQHTSDPLGIFSFMLQKEKHFECEFFIYMPKDQIFILQSCRFSSEVLIDT